MIMIVSSFYPILPSFTHSHSSLYPIASPYCSILIDYPHHFLSSSAFFFGFVVNEVTYDEANDEGLQEILYRPAPGNKTEKSFDFSLNLNAVAGGFVFGGKKCISKQPIMFMYFPAAEGDISFGVNVIRPTFRFRADDFPEDRVVTFNVIRDNIVEGQEIGQLQIARSTSFDGFEPMFQNVRIIINDVNSELKQR